ncbi:MAG: ABC transporter permease, partial [Acidobacteriota bacterium]
MTVAEPQPARRSLLNVAYQESRTEFLKALRMPAYSVPTIAFPVMFYLLFGVLLGSFSAGPTSMSTYLLATYGAFGVIGAAFFGFGVGLAVERGQGWMLLKQASPMPIWAIFLAKMVMSAIFAALIIAALFTVGLTLGDVEASGGQLLKLAGILLVGTLPFCAFGLFLAYICGPNSAPAVVNVIYLPMAFVSGLWIPIQALPEWL